jgi:heterodisulfide reductase subunit A-like polyferredoxin
MELGVRKATYKPYAQAIPGGFAIEKYDTAPCRMACPANLNVQGYVAMVKEGKYREAIEIIMRDLPFPGVLGRICPHRCEKSCRRLEVDQAISIRELKRVAADHVNLSEIPVPDITPQNKNVAVIGSGPAGLSAAYFLALDGYQVSVYESMPQAGGMMRYGIPEHRLPRSVLDAEIENLKRYGIKIHTNTVVGRDLTVEELRKGGASAIFLSTGAWKSLNLRIPGEDAEGVSDVTSFLREVHLGKLKQIEGKAVIIGGGHSALDGARVALRLGATEAHILYRRSRAEMLAEPEEIEETEKEGVKIHFLVAPVKISQKNGKASGIECIRTRLTEADTTGRRRPVPIEGSEFSIEANHIIPAIGQEPDLSFLGETHDLEISKWNLLVVNPETLQTNHPDIFAGGDVITGPATVIEAVEAGHRAANYISKYLQGEELPTEWQEEPPIGENWLPVSEDEPVKQRPPIPTLPVTERFSGFKEVNLLLDEQTAREEAARCLDCGACCECFQCVAACKAEAVTLATHAQQDQEVTINVGSVILAPGFTPFDPSRFETYKYASHPNVITSMEFERILSATGPYQGHLIRPSDQKEPKKIAWLQCVGSRDINQCDNTYCSSVCCMYAIKEALIAKEHSKDSLDTAIFYIDIRTHGKDFEKYYDRAREEAGVRFIKSRIANVVPVDNTGDLLIRYTDDGGKRVEEEFNLVVLSVGIDASEEAMDLAAKLGVELDAHHFASAGSFEPVATSKPGIFACGAFQGPKDIPQSVMESSACAAVVEGNLAEARGSMTRVEEIPQEIDVRGEPPRVGVFVCHCGTNIAGVVDVPGVVEYARTLADVVYVENNLFTCSQDTQEKITEVIREQKLNRVVVAACSPRTHEPLFQETVVKAGINKYLFEMANIRNQCSWVHSGQPDAATAKAKDLLHAAVSKVALLEPLYDPEIEMNQSALVIGGGLSGMTAAKNLAEQGYQTYLVEKNGELGGQALKLFETWKGEDVQQRLATLIEDVQSCQHLDVFLNTEIKAVDGFVGNFESTISSNGKEQVLAHGVTIIATGASEFKPDGYLYGQDPRVLTGQELDRKFIDNDLSLKEINSAVFVQCVGSRIKERPYCSKVCCTQSVKNALKLKELKPEMNVFIIYRDIRTYGRREDLYREAREKGIVFIRYEFAKELNVTLDDNDLKVRFSGYVLQREMEIRPDLLVLASAIVPPQENTIAQLFKVPLNDDGFFVEAHVKLRPMDFSTDGVFVCGLAHSPKPVEEAVAQGLGAASRAATLLSKDKVFGNAIVSHIDENVCRGCQDCIEACPFQAINYLEDRMICEVNQVVCKGCGACSVACPTGAANILHFTDDEVETMVEAALTG